MQTSNTTTTAALLARYDVFFLDAYGVLVSSGGALPGAAEFVARLSEAGKTVLILSNDASRSAETSWRRYRGFGLPLQADQILTSGALLRDHYARAGLAGAPTIVMGTDDSAAYVREAGGRPVAASDDSAEVVVVADDDGYDLLETVNDVVTVLLARLDRGQSTQLLLPNPDLLFPRGPGSFGITAGAIAAMIESILKLRDPTGSLRFYPLGKPHAPMFEAAMRRSPTQDKSRIVMIGDQVVTDIRGARDFGLDSVFVQSGIGREADCRLHGVSPTWLLERLS
jgi:HAD superfamily hydrolase (TIGR01450 family)